MSFTSKLLSAGFIRSSIASLFKAARDRDNSYARNMRLSGFVFSPFHFTTEDMLRTYASTDWSAADRNSLVFAAIAYKASRKIGIPIFVSSIEDHPAHQIVRLEHAYRPELTDEFVDFMSHLLDVTFHKYKLCPVHNGRLFFRIPKRHVLHIGASSLTYNQTTEYHRYADT